jgi:hypothetical protein
MLIFLQIFVTLDVGMLILGYFDLVPRAQWMQDYFDRKEKK